MNSPLRPASSTTLDDENYSVDTVDIEDITQNEIDAIKKVFKTMTQRRYERKFLGVDPFSTTSRKISFLFIISLIIYFIGMIVKYFISPYNDDLTTSEDGSNDSFGDYCMFYFNEILIMIVMTISIIFSLQILRPLIVILMFEMYWFTMIFFILECYNLFSTILFSVLLFVSVILLTLFISNFFATILRHIPLFIIIKPTIVSIEESSKGVRRYILETTNFITRKKKKYTLEGKMNANSLEGTIVWVDNQYLGESLTGEWKNGMLVGPFESMVIGQRSLIRSITLLSYDALFYQGNISFNYSLISVECCYSGNILYNLPKVTSIYQRKCQCIGDCTCARDIFDDIQGIKETLTEDFINIQLNETTNTIHLSGHPNIPKDINEITLKMGKRNDSKMRTINIAGIQEKETNRCIIYLTGSINKEQRQKEFAQFLAMAKFPDTVFPSIINLSQNNETPDYDDPYLHVAFANLLQSIISTPNHHINLIATADTILFLFKSFYLWKALIKDSVNIENLILVDPSNVPVLNYAEYKRPCIELFSLCRRTTIYSPTSSSSTIHLFEYIIKLKHLSHLKPKFETLDVIDVDDLDQINYFSFNEIFIQDVIELLLNNKPARLRSTSLQQYSPNFFKFSLVPKFIRMV